MFFTRSAWRLTNTHSGGVVRLKVRHHIRGRSLFTLDINLSAKLAMKRVLADTISVLCRELPGVGFVSNPPRGRG